MTNWKYGKSLSAGSCECFEHGFVHKLEIQFKPKNYAPGDNIELWRFLRGIAGAGHY